jgi:hypothetical protein
MLRTGLLLVSHRGYLQLTEIIPTAAYRMA